LESESRLSRDDCSHQCGRASPNLSTQQKKAEKRPVCFLKLDIQFPRPQTLGTHSQVLHTSVLTTQVFSGLLPWTQITPIIFLGSPACKQYNVGLQGSQSGAYSLLNPTPTSLQIYWVFFWRTLTYTNPTLEIWSLQLFTSWQT
jgi:hypothetical protein